MSVSDIVVLTQGGKKTAYYTDSVGFQGSARFLTQKHQEKNKHRGSEESSDEADFMCSGVVVRWRAAPRPRSSRAGYDPPAFQKREHTRFCAHRSA